LQTKFYGDALNPAAARKMDVCLGNALTILITLYTSHQANTRLLLHFGVALPALYWRCPS